MILPPSNARNIGGKDDAMVAMRGGKRKQKVARRQNSRAFLFIYLILTVYSRV
jgi:hypothetical protein